MMPAVGGEVGPQLQPNLCVPRFSGGRGRPPFYECSQWEFPTFSFPLKIYGFQGVRFLNRHWYFSRQLEPV
jgi:hypothetical protein